MLKTLTILTAIALTGCASPGYEQYLAAHQSNALARSQADTARYQALAAIASKGDSASGVAAAMALALGGNAPQAHIEAPRNELLQWAGVLVPALTQAYAIGKSADVAINASNNATQTSIATTSAFVGIAGKIQAPVVAPPTVITPTLPQANVSTVTTTDSHNTSTVSTVGDSMSGTGVLGSGSYNPQANPVTTTTTSNTPVFAPVVIPDVVQITPVFVPTVAP